MNSIDRYLRISLVACVVAASSLAGGHDTGPEFIESFDTTLELRDSGALMIRHVIDVHPHGDEIRRGLFFEKPDHVGPLTDFSATLAGKPITPEFDDGAVILAAAEPLATHQLHRFVLRYRADSPWWRVSSEAARLRWEPIIAQFELAWRDATLRVVWPEGSPPPKLPPGGAVEGNTWTRTVRGPLHGEGADPSVEQIEVRAQAAALPGPSIRHYGADRNWRAVLAIGILGLLGYLHGAWRAVGRDPDPGSVSMRSSPPDGLSPAATRFVDRMGFDQTTFVAALASLRVKQVLELSIDEENETLELERRRDATASMSPGERAMVEVLFGGREQAEFGPGDERAARASEALKKKLGEEHRGRHFVVNASQRAWGIALGVILAALSVVALIFQARDALTPDPWVIGLGFAALCVGVFAPLVYFELFKAPTRAGATIKRQIAGLRRYFEDDSTPVRDARQFAKLLPYAVALDCETAWRDRLESQDDSGLDRDAADVLAWYREFQRKHECIGAIVPVIAGATAAASVTGAGAGGGASAGGV